MRHITAALLPLMSLLALAGCATPARQVAPLVEEFTGQAPARLRSPGELQAAYDRVLATLIPDMAAATLPDRENAQQTFARICQYAGRPGAHAERLELCNVMVARLGPRTPQPARAWLIRQLERIGRAECVPALADLLTDPDTEVHELARKALQNNPSAEADAALHAALHDAATANERVAFVNALAARRDTDCLPELIRLATSLEPAVAAAAVAALGDIGGEEARTALAQQWRAAGPDELRPAIADAWMRCAERLISQEQNGLTQAGAIYAELYESGRSLPIRMAALRGLARTRESELLPVLLTTCLNEAAEFELRVLAANLAAELPGPQTTEAVLRHLATASESAQVILLRTLAQHGDATARAAVTLLLSSSSSEVRIAAAETLIVIGDQSAIPPLVQATVKADGAEREAERKALARIRGPEVDQALLNVLAPAEPPIRVECVRALSARQSRAAVPALLTETRHADAAVRAAALEALGQLAGEADLGELLAVLTRPDEEAVREAGENAVVSVSTRVEDVGRRTAAALAAWANADVPTRAALIRVLGRIGGPDALVRIRQCASDVEKDVRDAAVRALARWPSNEVLDDVFDVAERSDDQTHRVLALQACVRLIGLPAERDAQTTLNLYQKVISLAERPEEKKAVLAGVGNVRHVDALRMLQHYLANMDLRPEAEAAVISVARLIGPLQRPEAQQAFEQVLAQTTSDANRDEARKGLERLRNIAGYLLTWEYAGPYFTQGKEWPVVFATAYPPEKQGAAAVLWQSLPTTSPDQPWIYDLTTIDKGTQRCLYAQTMIWSPERRPVRVEVGSDDALKVWLNGKLVHQFEGIRAHAPFEDKVSVTLKPGWNTLRVKIVQAAGGWGFSCAVRNSDGAALDGLKFRAVAE